MTEDEVRQMLRDACAKLGSQGAWAERHNMTPAYVSDVLAGKRTFGPKILKALKLEAVRTITYRKAKK